MITEEERQAALEAVATWKEGVEQLRQDALLNNDDKTYMAACRSLKIHETIEAALNPAGYVKCGACGKRIARSEFTSDQLWFYDKAQIKLECHTCFHDGPPDENT